MSGAWVWFHSSYLLPSCLISRVCTMLQALVLSCSGSQEFKDFAHDVQGADLAHQVCMQCMHACACERNIHLHINIDNSSINSVNKEQTIMTSTGEPQVVSEGAFLASPDHHDKDECEREREREREQ